SFIITKLTFHNEAGIHVELVSHQQIRQIIPRTAADFAEFRIDIDVCAFTEMFFEPLPDFPSFLIRIGQDIDVGTIELVKDLIQFCDTHRTMGAYDLYRFNQYFFDSSLISLTFNYEHFIGKIHFYHPWDRIFKKTPDSVQSSSVYASTISSYASASIRLSN